MHMADPSGPRLISSSYPITIPTSPIINSFHRPPHLTIIKLAGMITLLILIPTALLPLTLQHSLFLKPPTPLPNSSMILPLLPFLLAASTVLLKPGGLLKSQMPLRNAERHLQRHTVSKKSSRTISLLIDIPPLWYLRLKLSHGSKLALAFLLKPIPVKSSLYFAPSLAYPPQLLLTFPTFQTAIPL